MICQFCRWGNTMKGHTWADGEKSPAETWCSGNHFDHKGFNSWPDKLECADFDISPEITLEDVHFAVIAYSAKERNRLMSKNQI